MAYQNNHGPWNWTVGAFAMDTRLYPGRDQSTGFTDHYTDLGLDASYQHFAANHDVVTVNGRYTHERQNLQASQALGLVTRSGGYLQDLRIDASYYWRNKIGLTLQAFDTWGSHDDILYSANRTLQPDSAGMVLQVDATPYGDGQSPLGRRFNLRVGVQYTSYFQFDGASRNYDGFGRNAADNNTLRVFTWIYY